MRTRTDWPRTDFFEWFDAVRREYRPDIPHDTALAEEARMSHSTISSWRSGRQRPTTSRLADVAAVLGIDPRYLWVRSGLMTADEVGLDGSSEPQPLTDADEATRAMILNSATLDERGKRELLDMLDQEAREDAARRQRLFARLVTGERTVKA